MSKLKCMYEFGSDKSAIIIIMINCNRRNNVYIVFDEVFVKLSTILSFQKKWFCRSIYYRTTFTICNISISSFPHSSMIFYDVNLWEKCDWVNWKFSKWRTIQKSDNFWNINSKITKTDPVGITSKHLQMQFYG